MGFGFRKSFGSGPFRFTVSPSGVSSSVGVRGARVTSGPRGTFVTVSSHGFYYRHRMDARNAVPASSTPSSTTVSVNPPVLDSVFQVPIDELVASSQGELIEQLNAAVSSANPAPLLLFIPLLSVVLLHGAPFFAAIFVIVGLITTAIAYQRVEAARTRFIHFSLDDAATRKFERVNDAISTLGSCGRLWALNTKSGTTDLKRNAGASSLITRTDATVGEISAKRIRVSIPFKSISANGTIFHFLPDQVLVFRNGKYASVEYHALAINAYSTRFIEEESVPYDSVRVDSTWKYVNKNGSPDRRFNNNRQLPILQYGEVSIFAPAGLKVLLQTSSFQKAALFISKMDSILSVPKTSNAAPPPGPDSPQDPPPPRNKVPSAKQVPTLLQCYELLGITRPATLEQAAAAHRRQASLYHPDKYEHLAPEMKALAALKMQEMNAAYSRVKLDLTGN